MFLRKIIELVPPPYLVNRSIHPSITRGKHTHDLNNVQSEPIKPFDAIPGLTLSLPVIGPIQQFLSMMGFLGPQKTFYDLCKLFYENYGSIVKLSVFSRADIVILYEPEDFDQIFRAEDISPSRPGFQTLVYYRTELKKMTFDGVYGLTTAEGAQWRDFRTKVNPIFLKPKLVKLYTPALSEIADDMLFKFKNQLDNKNNINKNFDEELTKWSLESVAYVGLGSRIGCLKDDLKEDDPAKILITCAKEVLEYTWALEFRPSPWKYFSTPTFKKLMRTYDRQWETSAFLIKEAKRQISERGQDIPEEDKSIIEKLLAVDEKVAIMMASEMLLAGIDTVAFSVTSILYNLAVNPEVQDKLREEIHSENASKRYLKACIKEALRIYPVVSTNLRRTTKDHIVRGYHIPAGIDILSPNEFLSKMEKYYPEPTQFIPERWIVEKSNPLYYGNTHPMVTQPFGFGVRSCIGRRIAELEIEILMQKLIGELKVTWTGPPIQTETKVLNAFKKPYHFKFEHL
ncbi:probable cytochrome P450 12a5, mitochondrial isoform X1 [Pieris napi]|uniref:probable cytochrome P450 12a5, mitochondrial isoform X1 n=2 Tax=Pieris napi TaxID=78633 RepID=UPI001FBA73CA|nr:probable cytochrome P450 12a5, mitochondrial isoform X1 [Pieris napi]